MIFGKKIDTFRVLVHQRCAWCYVAKLNLIAPNKKNKGMKSNENQVFSICAVTSIF